MRRKAFQFFVFGVCFSYLMQSLLKTQRHTPISEPKIDEDPFLSDICVFPRCEDHDRLVFYSYYVLLFAPNVAVILFSFNSGCF